MPDAVHIVVPCFDEELRLDVDELVRLGDRVHLHLVDDGSRDGTVGVLNAIAARSPNARVHVLSKNAGKAEAVRKGLLAALADGADVVGFLDADLSTGVDAMLALVDESARTDVDVVLGSRVLMLGRAIARSPSRHYLGRVFATAASLALGLPVYDTQCGAKLFRRTPALVHAVSTPFHARWAFDVELLSRLLRAGLDVNRVVEVPLQAWRDVKGSKVTAAGSAKALADLAWIAVRHRRELP